MSSGGVFCGAGTTSKTSQLLPSGLARSQCGLRAGGNHAGLQLGHGHHALKAAHKATTLVQRFASALTAPEAAIVKDQLLANVQAQWSTAKCPLPDSMKKLLQR